MTDYRDIVEVNDALARDQEAEYDLRLQVDEEVKFLNHPQGQWEPDILDQTKGRPAYQFDLQNQACERTWSQMAANDYTTHVKPLGEGATKATSKIISGMMRSSDTKSGFSDISKRSGKRMIKYGFAAWRLMAKYSGKSFNQDVLKEIISDPHRRVWFDCDSEMQTRSDAMHAWVLSNIYKPTAEKMFSRVDGFTSLDPMQWDEGYQYKPSDTVILGEIFYKEPAKTTIYLMEDGSVSETPDGPVVDEREIETFKVYTRKFDAKQWLTEPKLTAFEHLPIIAEYANFDINENKVTFKGLVRDRMDAQRVYNYIGSREVEETVLAIPEKILMDNRVAAGYEEEMGNINRDPRRVQLFNGKGAANSAIPFQVIGGVKINPGLSALSDRMISNMDMTSGLPNEVMIAQQSQQDSNFRFDQRDQLGQTGTYEYYESHRIALEWSRKVELSAYPTVYDTTRSVQIVDESGEITEETINAVDPATGAKLNNITIGSYEVEVKAGPAMKSRQAEANSAILEVGAIVPGVLERNTDIIARNMDAPGMDVVASRERAFLMDNRVIPEEEWTDEERARAEQAQAESSGQPDPVSMMAQAETMRAESEAQKAQFQALEAQAKLELQQMKQQTDSTLDAMKLELQQSKQDYDNLKTAVEALKISEEIGGPVDQQTVDQAEAEI